jgi:hypothetical protein
MYRDHLHLLVEVEVFHQQRALMCKQYLKILSFLSRPPPIRQQLLVPQEGKSLVLQEGKNLVPLKGNMLRGQT